MTQIKKTYLILFSVVIILAGFIVVTNVQQQPKTTINPPPSDVLDTSDWLHNINKEYNYSVRNITPALFDWGTRSWLFSKYRHDYGFDKEEISYVAPLSGDIIVTVYGISTDVEKGVINTNKTDYKSFEDLIETWTKMSTIIESYNYTSSSNVEFVIYERQPVDGMESGYMLEAYTQSEKWLYKIVLMNNKLDFVEAYSQNFFDFIDTFQFL